MAVLLDPGPQRVGTADLLDAALEEIDTVWDALDLSDVKGSRAVLTELITDLGESYGGLIADLAVESFSEARELSQVLGNFTPVPAPGPSASQVDMNVYRSLSDLLGSEPNESAALSRVKAATSRLLQQPGRQTIQDNVKRDSKARGFARVPRGMNTCGFCYMTASRGAVYKNAKSAGGDGHRYHDGCHCLAIPVFDTETEIKNYDPEAYRQVYEDARKEAGSNKPKDIANAINKATGHNKST